MDVPSSTDSDEWADRDRHRPTHRYNRETVRGTPTAPGWRLRAGGAAGLAVARSRGT